jgi:hypothetical protein
MSTMGGAVELRITPDLRNLVNGGPLIAMTEGFRRIDDTDIQYCAARCSSSKLSSKRGEECNSSFRDPIE